MKVINKIKILIADLLLNYPIYVINTFVYIFYRKAIQVNAWVDIRHGNVKHRNWGDDINVYLLEKISRKKIIIRNQSLFHRFTKDVNYICIGSILGLYENSHSVIWGAGFIDSDKSLLCKPSKICSVRGKYTHEMLQKIGYDCPAVYGDPALLVSRFYVPHIENKPLFRIGFILHYVDSNNDLIKTYMQEHGDCLIISLSEYELWTDVVDKICSCEFIISSSLHGLIVSDSYGIPNAWVRLSDKVLGGNFKFHDYFSSVNRTEIDPNIIKSNSDIDKLYDCRVLYEKPHIDYEGILKSCPFL